MNLALSTSTLTGHILLETLEEGYSAWIAEFSDCRVIAESKEAAIAALEILLNKRMETIEVIPLPISSGNSENIWLKLGGSLKDNPSFIEWSDRFWDDKQQNTDDDELLSVEDCLRLM